MRREISEPKHWRSKTYGKTAIRRFSSERRQDRSAPTLPADAVDAAFATEAVEIESDRGSRRDLVGISSATKPSTEIAHERPDLINSLANQLSKLEAQHKQLSRLLAQAQGNQD